MCHTTDDNFYAPPSDPTLTSPSNHLPIYSTSATTPSSCPRSLAPPFVGGERQPHHHLNQASALTQDPPWTGDGRILNSHTPEPQASSLQTTDSPSLTDHRYSADAASSSCQELTLPSGLAALPQSQASLTTSANSLQVKTSKKRPSSQVQRIERSIKIIDATFDVCFEKPISQGTRQGKTAFVPSTDG